MNLVLKIFLAMEELLTLTSGVFLNQVHSYYNAMIMIELRANNI
jgi:hypothetical protein